MLPREVNRYQLQRQGKLVMILEEFSAYDVDGIRSTRTNPPSIQKILLKRNRNHKNDNHGFHCQFSLTILLCLRSDTRHYGYSNRYFYLLTYYSGTILVFFLTEFRYDSLFSE